MDKEDDSYAHAAVSMFSSTECPVLEQLNLLRPSKPESPKAMDGGLEHPDSSAVGNAFFDMLSMQFPCVEAMPQDRLILTDIVHFTDHGQRINSNQSIVENEANRDQDHAGFDPICFLKLPVLAEKGVDNKNPTPSHEFVSLPLTQALGATDIRENDTRNKGYSMQHIQCVDFRLSAPGYSGADKRLESQHARYSDDDGQIISGAATESIPNYRSEQNYSTSPNTSEKLLNDQQAAYSDALQPVGLSQCSSGLDPQNYRVKRKRSKSCKNSDEVESQRMTHIAVERNRRKQMNEHLRVLRSLMPGSYVQRGDQASIIGGAIEFVKELEQLLQCLESQKRRRMFSDGSRSSSQNSSLLLQPSQLNYPAVQNDVTYPENYLEPLREDVAEVKSPVADVEVKLVGYDAMLKILSQRRPGQLLKTIAALENLHLTILHTNITTIEHTVLYSFNVKVSLEGRSTAEEIATSIQQIFNMIHTGNIS